MRNEPTQRKLRQNRISCASIYRDLKVWQLASALCSRNLIKPLTGFRETNALELRSQIRGAASSVPANIAEGQGPEAATR